MGLDGLEIVLDVEDEFKIALSDEEVSEAETVGQFVDLVYARLRHNASEPCPSQHAFYVVRRCLMNELGTERSRIAPETLLEDLIVENGRRQTWRKVLQSVAGEDPGWPRLVYPTQVNILGRAVPVAVLLLQWPLWGFELAFVEALIVAFLCACALKIDTPRKNRFPRGFVKVKDLIKFVKSLDARTWSRDAVFDKVRAIVARELGVDESKVTMEARFIKDLGLS